MTEPSKNPFDVLLEQIRQVVREEVTMAMQSSAPNVSQQDTLLTTEKAAELMGVTPRWLYRHAGKLPFTRRISRKNLRFSEAGLRRWITLRKPDSRR
jgi:excisionase family DNA binding protein